MENATVETIIQQDHVGQEPKKIKNKNAAHLQKRLQGLCKIERITVKALKIF